MPAGRPPKYDSPEEMQHIIDLYSVKSIDAYTFFTIKSPVRCKRTFDALKEALGGKIKIDGIEYKITGVRFNLPNTDISIGERIGIEVKGGVK
jgi:hypothetical protein